MTSDIHALVGAYAVDALDADERAEFEKHLATCETCRAEVASLTEAAAQLSAISATEPPASLRDKVLADITTVRPLAPAVRPAARIGQRPRHRRAFLAAVAAAAVIVLGVAGGVVAWHPWTSSHGPVAVTEAQQVIGAADVQRTKTTLHNGASLTLYRSPSLDRAVLVTSAMPAAPPSKVYELWIEDHHGTMHPAGLMPPTAAATVVLQGSAATARGVGVTVEPAGGSPQPTSAPIVLLPFQNA